MIITHRIAGIVLRVESEAWLPLLQDEPFALFRIDDVEPDVVVRIHRVSADSLTLPPPTGLERALLSNHTLGWPGRLESRLLCSPPVRVMLQSWPERQSQVEAEICESWVIIRDFDRRTVDMFYLSEPARHPAEDYVAGHYSRLFSTFLPSFSAVLVHGASMIRGGRAPVFLGASGAGKTTVVGLAGRVPILSDDQVVLRRQGGVSTAWATPLAKKTSGPCVAEIGGLFLLEMGRRFELTLLRPADVVQCLWAATYFNTSLPTRNHKNQLFATLYDISHQTPAYRMRFPKDYVDWDAIDAAMVR